MRYRSISLISGGIVLAFSVLLVACASQGVMTATPAGVAATAPPARKCPTPTFVPTPPPVPTLNPTERTTPGAVETAFARYHATYPVDSYQNIKVTDLAPQLAMQDKSTVIVLHGDCTLERVLLSSAQVTAYINALPPSDTALGGAPPASAPNQVHLPGVPVPTPIPGQTPGVGYDKNGTPVTAPSTPPGGLPSPPSPALLTAVAHQAATYTSGVQTATAVVHGTSSAPTPTP